MVTPLQEELRMKVLENKGLRPAHRLRALSVASQDKLSNALFC